MAPPIHIHVNNQSAQIDGPRPYGYPLPQQDFFLPQLALVCSMSLGLIKLTVLKKVYNYYVHVTVPIITLRLSLPNSKTGSGVLLQQSVYSSITSMSSSS